MSKGSGAYGYDNLGVVQSQSDRLRIPANYDGDDNVTIKYYLEDVAGYGCQKYYGQIYSCNTSSPNPQYNSTFASASVKVKLCDNKQLFCCSDVDNDGIMVGNCCDLKVASFSGQDTIIQRDSGGTVLLKGSISESSGEAVKWDVSVAGRQFVGSGKSPSIIWDGKRRNGKVVEVGSHLASLHAERADDPDCDDSKSVNFLVTETTNPCMLKVTFGSSANIAGGELNDSLPLFSAPGLPGFDLTLAYRSQDGASGSLGMGWRHSLEVALNEHVSGEVVLAAGNGRYLLYQSTGNGNYTSQPGDYAALTKNSAGGWTRILKGGDRQHFDTDGRLVAQVDRNGNTLIFVYDGDLLRSVTDDTGRTATLSYDSNGHLLAVTDPAGNLYQLNVTDTLQSVTFPDGATWNYTYADNAFLIGKRDPLGNLTTYTYDEQHRVGSSIDPEGRVRTLAYPTADETVRTTTFTEKDGGVWRYSYDTVTGDLLSKADPEGNTTSYTYDANHNQLTRTDLSGTTAYTYDATGNMTSVTDVAGQITTYTYNAFGQVTSSINSEERITSYEYDDRGNLTKTTGPTDAVIAYAYDARGNLISVTDPAGRTTAMTYDATGNMNSITDPAGATTRFEYDAAGRMTRQTDPQGNVLSFEYDARGNLIKVVDPLGNAISATFDKNGNKTSETDANGNTTYYGYNYKGQLIKMTDQMGYITAYTYGGSGCFSCGNGADKLTAVTDPKGNTTTFQYDTLGKLVSETDPLGNITTYAYDDGGNLTRKTDANGATVIHSYDSIGRLKGRRYPDGTEEVFLYDDSGNLISWQAPAEKVELSYDSAKRLTAKTYQTLGKGIRYEYDVSGRKSVMIDPEGGRTVYSYDAAGRVIKITDPTGNSVVYSYDTGGRKSAVAYSNGTLTSYTYDPAGRLLDMSTNGPSGVISSYQYTYDKMGNRLSVKEAGGNSTTYTYDKLYRLTAYDETRPDAAKGSFEYDQIGNRTKMVLARKFVDGDSRSFTYTYNPENQLLNIIEKGRHSPVETVFDYDQNGSLIRQSVTQRKTTATTTYSHDYQSRLSQVTTSDGKTVTVDNFPDGFSRLAKTTEAGTTSYFHDGMSVLSEYDASGTRTARYTLGIGMDEIIARKDADGTFFYHYDGLGSVTAITDSTGKVMARYDYEPFGRMKEATGATINNPYTYTGREWDRETGLYFYRARYYDPMEGRFVSKDPIGFKGGINLYAYVGNRPTTKNDPYGLKYDSYGEWEAQFIIGYGQAYVTCCDGCTLWKHKYRKVCFGAGFVGGVSSGASLCDVPNGCKNPPKHIIAPQGGFGIYGPLGIEGGFSFDVEGDADSPYIGGSGGTGFKATVCYYWLSESKEMGGCSK